MDIIINSSYKNSKSIMFYPSTVPPEGLVSLVHAA